MSTLLMFVTAVELRCRTKRPKEKYRFDMDIGGVIRSGTFVGEETMVLDLGSDQYVTYVDFK